LLNLNPLIKYHCLPKNIGRDQPVQKNIHSLSTFSDIVDISIGAENHRMPYWSHCRNEQVYILFYITTMNSVVKYLKGKLLLN